VKYKISKNNFYPCLITTSLIAWLLFSDDIGLSQNLYLYYVLQLITFIFFLFRRENKLRVIDFLLPSNFVLIYLFFGLILGSYSLPRYEALYGMSDEFGQFQFLKQQTIYFLLANLTIYLSFNKEKYEELTTVNVHEKAPNKMKLLFAGILFVATMFFKINLGFLGGSDGEWNYPFVLFAFIILVIQLRSLGIFRIPIYAFLILILISQFYHSKREILFAIIALLLVELGLSKRLIRLSTKNILYSIGGVLILIFIILSSSILRGYGNFGNVNTFQSFYLITDYVNNPKIIALLLNNFEISYSFFHSSNSLEYFYKGKIPLLWGETIIKPLFLPFPREVIGFKPNSMVDIYTTSYDNNFRASGGSFPITFTSEVFLNFWYFGLIFLFFFFRILNKFCLESLINLRLGKQDFFLTFQLFLLVTIIQFVRGGGLELWLIYPLVGSIAGIIFFLPKILNVK